MELKEKIFFYILLGFITTITVVIAVWWSSYFIFRNEKIIESSVVLAFIIGIGINLKFLKKIVLNAYKFNIAIWIFIYVLYSIGMLVFFMGVPIFNILLGIPASYYIIRKNKSNTEKICNKLLHKISLFSVSILFIICMLSAFIALNDKYTGSSLKGMLGLSFEVTKTMVINITIVGGIILLLLQYMLTYISGKIFYKNVIRN